MKLIMNGINGKYLRDILLKLDSVEKTDEVLAAVAYATDTSLLFDWCWNNNIPLKYYGRLDDGVAVSINVLNNFFNKKSANFVCKLVEHHHAKVIWWRGFGLYIGSANLTGKAWGNNTIETGCFFSEEDKEIDDDMASDLFALFAKLEEHSTPLTEELVIDMQKRLTVLKENVIDATEFWKSLNFTRWDGLGRITNKKPNEIKREEFLQEWYATLQELRDIGERVSQPKNRPKWINDTVPMGAQADQFLHAHYYERAFSGRKSNHNHLFEENKNRKEAILTEAIEWWRNLPQAPDGEGEMLNDIAPFLQQALSQQALRNMDEIAFHEICMQVHAITNYANRVRNKSVNLPSDGTKYNNSKKIQALAQTIWNDDSSAGERVKGLLNFILYDGTEKQLPERLWQGVSDPKWKIKGLGISSLGEIVGWALPDTFPPRNGRTSKALKSLGYDVKIHVG